MSVIINKCPECESFVLSLENVEYLEIKSTETGSFAVYQDKCGSL